MAPAAPRVPLATLLAGESAADAQALRVLHAPAGAESSEPSEAAGAAERPEPAVAEQQWGSSVEAIGSAGEAVPTVPVDAVPAVASSAVPIEAVQTVPVAAVPAAAVDAVRAVTVEVVEAVEAVAVGSGATEDFPACAGEPASAAEAAARAEDAPACAGDVASAGEAANAGGAASAGEAAGTGGAASAGKAAGAGEAASAGGAAGAGDGNAAALAAAWLTRFAPRRAEEVCGNRDAATEVLQWLQAFLAAPVATPVPSAPSRRCGLPAAATSTVFWQCVLFLHDAVFSNVFPTGSATCERRCWCHCQSTRQ